MSLSFSLSTQTEWNTLPLKHWVHTWEYGLVQQQSGRTVSHLIIRCRATDVTLGYFVAITYRMWRERTITYLPYGPVWFNEPSDQQLGELQTWLRQYGQKYNSIAVRCELTYPVQGFYKLPLSAYRTSFHQPRGEAVLELHPEWQDKLSKSTLRNIKKSKQNNLTISFSHGREIPEQVGDFIDLNDRNTRTHGTTTHTATYFKNLFLTLSHNPHNFVATVSRSNTVLAMNVFTVFGDQADCPFGASSNEGKQLGAYYFIKEQSIKHLVSQGVTTFNWGGIAIGKNDHNLTGLNQFKLGWGTTELHHADFYDLVISPLYYIYLLRSRIKNIYTQK